VPGLSDIPVADAEVLARFVLKKDEVRQDGTLRPLAFMAYRHVDLSVTRHRDFTEKRLWGAGRCAAIKRRLTLLGRADISAHQVRKTGLEIKPAEGPGLGPRNHANIVRYPQEKSEQVSFAQALARMAKFKNAG
jgi:hypothetical protein